MADIREFEIVGDEIHYIIDDLNNWPSVRVECGSDDSGIILHSTTILINEQIGYELTIPAEHFSDPDDTELVCAIVEHIATLPDVQHVRSILYQTSPCANTGCMHNDGNSVSGCTVHGKHYISACKGYRG